MRKQILLLAIIFSSLNIHAQDIQYAPGYMAVYDTMGVFHYITLEDHEKMKPRIVGTKCAAYNQELKHIGFYVIDEKRSYMLVRKEDD